MAKIYIYDEYNPEDTAMMQALYSRSPESVVKHVEKVKQTGSGKFMETFYVGYGHSSIGDCGSTTIFFENLSILADKAIQDWPLYSGQETSTRYVDMSKQPIEDPLNTDESKMILKKWMDFYIDNLPEVKNYLISLYPKKGEDDEKIYLKAINARSFDIMRSFLPAGIHTQLSWHTNLRQAHDKLCWLRHNPLPEIRKMAEETLSLLKEKYGHSFNHVNSEKQEEYYETFNKKYNFYFDKKTNDAEWFFAKTNIDKNELNNFSDIIMLRPEKTSLPQMLADLGNVTFEFTIDYGSFRDIQRHRNGVCHMPLLTTNIGFNDWYLNELPVDVREKAQKLISEQIAAINNLETSNEIKQYYISLGFNVSCKNTYGLPAAIYTTELRSGKMVHPTLRKVAHKMHKALKDFFPDLILYSDLEASTWDVSRGKQDIVEKK